MTTISLEALSVLFFLLPGYLSFYLIQKFAPLPKKYSQHHTIMRGLFLSFFIWIFLIVVKLGNLEDLSIIFEAENALWIITITLGASVTIIALYKIYYKINKLDMNLSDPWNIFMQELNQTKAPGVVIKTKKGDLFGGVLKNASSFDQEKEIILAEPKKLIVQNNKVIEEYFGKRIYFNSNEIEYIIDVSKN